MIGGKGWLGGVNYILLLAKAINTLRQDDRPMLFLIVSDQSLGSYEYYANAIGLFKRVIFVGANIQQARTILPANTFFVSSEEMLFEFIDFLYPITSNVLPGRCAASWIEDFQHFHLPEFFSSNDIASRNERYSRIAKEARLIVFSSKSVLKDFNKFFPDSKATTKILSFFSQPDSCWYDQPYGLIQKKYHLPDRYIICCNQFWVHKNHLKLIQAVEQLKSQGQSITLVCTGSTDDYRARDYHSQLLGYIAAHDLADEVRILGIIPREDQIQLIRRSMFVVQPSLFEGWSTVVEDCRVLGKTIILSDLDVHIEQNPRYAIFFDRNSSNDLTSKIGAALLEHAPGPDLNRERIALADSVQMVGNFARQFCNIVQTAVFEIGKRNFSVSENWSIRKATEKKIEIVTSLTPGRIEIQKSAVQSWIKLGFAVTSMNSAEEIPMLESLFPEVKLIQINSDTHNQFGYPFVYLHDIFEYFSRQKTAICGMIKPDVVLQAKCDIQAFLEREAKNGMVFGSQVELENFSNTQGIIDRQHFAYFFFDRSIISIFPKEKFCFNQPTWDYWLPIVPLAKGYVVKYLITPLANHIVQTGTQDGIIVEKLRKHFGLILAKYCRTPEPITENTVEHFLHLANLNILKNARKINLE